MIALGADDDVDHSGPPGDLLAFGLGDTAGHDHGDSSALAGRRLLERPDPAEFGINLLGGLFANVAGVQDHHVGIRRRGGLQEAFLAQQIRHTIGIVDVHLTAVGLDVNFARCAHAVAKMSVRAARAQGASQGGSVRWPPRRRSPGQTNRSLLASFAMKRNGRLALPTPGPNRPPRWAASVSPRTRDSSDRATTLRSLPAW